jgi:Tfp pilus assembly protein FimT
MKKLETKADNRRRRASGFSLVEMAITMAILIITAVVSVVSLVPMVNAQHVTNAYNTTLAALRQARDCSVSQRTSYQVTFNQVVGHPTNIAVTGTLAFAGDPCTVTFQYPTDVFFSGAARWDRRPGQLWIGAQRG